MIGWTIFEGKSSSKLPSLHCILQNKALFFPSLSFFPLTWLVSKKTYFQYYRLTWSKWYCSPPDSMWPCFIAAFRRGRPDMVASRLVGNKLQGVLSKISCFILINCMMVKTTQNHLLARDLPTISNFITLYITLEYSVHEPTGNLLFLKFFDLWSILA